MNIKGASLIGFSGLASAAAGLLFSVTAARLLSVSDYGFLSALIALSALLVSASAGALGQVLLRELLKNSEVDTPVATLIAIARISFLFVIVLGLAWALATAAFNGRFISTTEVFAIALFFASAFWIELAINQAMAERSHSLQAAFMFFTNATRLAVMCAAGSWLGSSVTVETFFVALIPVGILGCSLGLYTLMQGSPIKFRASLSGNIDIAVKKDYFDFFKVSVFQATYYHSGLILLPLMATEGEAGYFSAAYIFITGAYFFPSLVTQRIMFPVLHRLLLKRGIDAISLIKRMRKMYLFCGCVVSMFFIGTADELIALLYEGNYSRSTDLLRALALSIPFIFGSFTNGLILTFGSGPKRKGSCLLVAAIFNLILNLILIPSMGAIGAAIATVASAVLISWLYRMAAQSQLKALFVASQLTPSLEELSEE